jgi:hypothetical protein
MEIYVLRLRAPMHLGGRTPVQGYAHSILNVVNLACLTLHFRASVP